MVDLAQKKEENERINAELMALQEYALIQKDIKHLDSINSSIGKYKEQIVSLQASIKDCEGGANECKARVKELLESIEAQSGYSKAPGLAHLMTVAEKYEVKNVDAIPSEYIITEITSKLDKKKLNQAIKDGKVDLKSNWLEVAPGYKVVVIA